MQLSLFILFELLLVIRLKRVCIVDKLDKRFPAFKTEYHIGSEKTLTESHFQVLFWSIVVTEPNKTTLGINNGD
jgi:hypothetical protein